MNSQPNSYHSGRSLRVGGARAAAPVQAEAYTPEPDQYTPEPQPVTVEATRCTDTNELQKVNAQLRRLVSLLEEQEKRREATYGPVRFLCWCTIIFMAVTILVYIGAFALN